ncbi:MAG TPA: tetratricopeptide repeat protein [Bryobacteraceae bacterium]|nr:tetratricopeptide repeat protein [Bryobacteraceae bacterium]
MARSFRPAQPAPDEFNGATFFHEPSREWFRMFQRDGSPWVRRWQSTPAGGETNILEERVDYVIGAGDRAVSYLHRTRDNKLVELPVSWYRENGGHWGMSPAYDRPDHPGFSREVNFACTVCHTAYPAAETDGMPGETIFPAQSPKAVDCQRCHGPGRNHVQAATAGEPAEKIRAAIVNPARLNPQRRGEVCLQCHLETTSSRLPALLFRPGRSVFSYRPGESLGDFVSELDRAAASNDSVEFVSAPYRLARSACRTANGQPLECIACHDPHRAASRDETLRRTVGLCVSCHAPHNARNDCVSCHMPSVKAADVIHASVTDHWISKPGSATAPEYELNARSNPPYAGPVVSYYPAAFESPLDQALAQVQSNPREALQLLNRLLPGGRAPEIGRAFLTLGQPAKAISLLNAPPQDAPSWIELGNAQQAAGQYEPAIESFRQAIRLAPEKTDILLLLGEAYAKADRLQEAISTLRDAVARNPESAAACNDLGAALLSARSSLAEAESVLREAVRLQPEFSSIRMNLAGVLIRGKKLAEAREQLEEAARIGGRAETAEAAWFAAFIASNDPATAEKAWRSSFGQQVAGAHANLGTIAASQQRTEDAIREYRLAVAGDPQSAIAQLNLGITLYNAGRRDEALLFLKNAAASDDPGIRGAAQTILERK